MSVSIARQRLHSARTELERCKEKQAAEEKKAAGLEKDAESKEHNARSTSSPSLREGLPQASDQEARGGNPSLPASARHGPILRW
jgi:hypothetical protein